MAKSQKRYLVLLGFGLLVIIAALGYGYGKSVVYRSCLQ